MIDFPYLAYDYEAFKHIYTLASHLRRGKGAYNDKKKKRRIQQRTANIPVVIREPAWIIRDICAPIYINKEGGGKE